MDQLRPEALRAAAAFSEGAVRLRPLGDGRINDTFLVEGPAAPFVLQRLSALVFPDPELVVANFARISGHLRRRSRQEGLPLQVAEPVPGRNGALSHRDEAGGCWRAQSYLPHQPGFRLTSRDEARGLGETLATFHHLLSDLDKPSGNNLSGSSEASSPPSPSSPPIQLEAAVLPDPLPGFHHLPGYLETYERALAEWRGERGGVAGECLAAIARHRPAAGELERARLAGRLRAQPVHGDPKVDNFLFNSAGRPQGLIDLDTVRIGFVVHDLADSLRSVGNRAGEGGGAAAVSLDLALVEAVVDGYRHGPGGVLPADFTDLLFAGLVQISYELGLRFFTDYLQGNRYFRVQGAEDNLHRARTQLRLTEAIIGQERAIRRLAG